MKISILLPTHRIAPSAVARVLELASLDPEKFEVIVRDNSENSAKRAILENIDSPTLRLHFAQNRGPLENSRESLKLATGEFVFFMGDDDWLWAHAFNELHRLGTDFEFDDTVVGLNGIYLLDAPKGMGVFQYKDLDSADALVRLRSVVDANGPNMSVFVAVRRSCVDFCVDLARRFPYPFSYHDWLISLMYTVLGRTLKVNRVFYTYDLGEWETEEKAIAKDRAFYAATGLPLEYDRLHWLLCALEGALLLNSQLLSQRASYDKQLMINAWFAMMLPRFRNGGREAGFRDNAVNDATRRLRDKWIGQAHPNLNELLLDVTTALEVGDPQGASRYFDFWSSL